MEAVLRSLTKDNFRFVGIWDAEKARQVLREVQAKTELAQVPIQGPFNLLHGLTIESINNRSRSKC